jgi:putative nucleotidyltransferase with HDIG domain
MLLEQSRKEDKITIRILPSEVVHLLEVVRASPRLIAHLTLVHDTAVRITDNIDEYWPCLAYDKQAVIFGAATHDIGKVLYPNELVESGTNHERVGASILIEHGFPEKLARFAQTHGQWEENTNVEDLLVALADKNWKGARHKDLEGKIVQIISATCNEEDWKVFLKFDDLLSGIADSAHERLDWYSKQPL